MEFPKLSIAAWSGIITNILAIVGGLTALWVQVESKISEITIKNTETVALIFAEDIRTRINFKEAEIESLIDSGNRVPDIDRFKLKALEDQYAKLREWSDDHKAR